MRVKKLLARLKRLLKSRYFRKYAAIFIVALVIMNLIVGLVYRGKTYPKTKVASKTFSGVRLSDASSKLESLRLLPDKLTLNFNQQTTQLAPNEIGITVDAAQIYKSIQAKRSWLPAWNLIVANNAPLKVATDDSVLNAALAQAISPLEQEPSDAKLVLEKDEFKIVPEVLGHKLNLKTAKTAILDAIAEGQFNIQLPAEVSEPATKQNKLQTTLEILKKQQSTSVTLTYNDKTKKLTTSDITSMFVAGDKTFDLSDPKIRAVVQKTGSEFGIGVKNINEAVTAVVEALTKNKELNFKLEATPKTAKAFTYCVAAKGVDASYLDALSIKLASVFSDNRGWGLDGLVTYSKVAEGCNFTVWLAAADQMSSFGSICDADWSCTVSPNVVINFKRWQEASAAWNAAGGSLDDYRSMVINHETGHWLGFNHKNCPGAGQSAPVMQQQSIDLQGCKFNPWPLDSEKAELKTVLGISN